MCGIAGIFGHKEASKLAYLALYALQHRGQESAGIISTCDGHPHQHRQMGLVADIFTADVLKKLPGDAAIGHVRYSTFGNSTIENAQPFFVNAGGGFLAVAHNGNLTNALSYRRLLEKDGAIFQSTMDTEVICHLIAKARGSDLTERIIAGLKEIEGAYSLLFLSDKMMIAACDPLGMRPLVLGRLDSAHVVSSESCAFDLIGATFERSLKPGEILVMTKDGATSYFPFAKPKNNKRCIFEYIYFSRPDSVVFDQNVYRVREGFGKMLAKQHPVAADIVIPVPDSGVPAALGFARESKIPYEMGFIRNHYVGRTFIEPEDHIRHFGVKIKLNPLRHVLKDKRVVVVDDSIVRGTTSKKIVDMIRQSGAKEVHFRVSSPPTAWPCFYGIDTPTREELIAASKSVEGIRQFIGADSLGYLDRDSLYWFAENLAESFCDACFTGNYPDQLTDYPDMKI